MQWNQRTHPWRHRRIPWRHRRKLPRTEHGSPRKHPCRHRRKLQRKGHGSPKHSPWKCKHLRYKRCWRISVDGYRTRRDVVTWHVQERDHLCNSTSVSSTYLLVLLIVNHCENPSGDCSFDDVYDATALCVAMVDAHAGEFNSLLNQLQRLDDKIHCQPLSH